MAFNPFEAFSVRSKLGRSVMAILGIVVMLTFVLSTGAFTSQNDFFHQLTGALSSGSKGDVLAVAYDEKIRESELAEVARQRRAANTFLQAAVDASYANWARELKQDLEGSRLSPETKRDLERFVNLRVNRDTDPRAYAAFLNDLARFGPEAQRLGQAMMRARVKPESEDKKALDAVAAIIMHDLGQSPFFLVELGETDRDLLNFILLLKKADRLGINYSREGILDLVTRDTGGRFTKKDNGEIEAAMRRSGRFGEFGGDWLVQAIANEYRARSALAALQGKSPAVAELKARRGNSLPAIVLGIDPSGLPFPGELQTATAMPGAVTPHEFFEFYKDRCSEHTFSLIGLRAEDFLDRVKEEPTPKERVELFNRYRAELPDPAKPTPGFKEPRKVRVEYVTLDATAPRVTQAIPRVKAASLFLCASSGAIAGSPVASLAEAAQPAMAESLPAREAVSQKMQENVAPYQSIDQWEFHPRDVSIYRPQPIVAALGVLAGGPDVATFTAAVTAARQHVALHDLRTRVPILMQSVLTPFNPTLGNAVGMPAFAYALHPKLPPEGLYLATVTEDLKKRQRQRLFEADVRQLETKVFELTKDASPFAPKPDKSKVAKAREDAKKYLTDWLKDRGLTPAGNKEPKDQYALVADPDLKPLNEKALPEPDGTNSLSKKLFETFDMRQLGGAGTQFRVQPYTPEWFPADPVGNDLDKPNFFVWVSDEVAANTYPSLANADTQTKGEMTRLVDRAWKLEKARKLAQDEADRLAEKVKAVGKSAASNPDGVEKQLRDLAEQYKGKARKFDLERLALLKFQHEATQARMGYERPKIDKSLVLYPTDNFADRLLELRKEPVGGVTVLPDAPRANFYVACEVRRFEKTVDQFRDVFAKATAVGPAHNPLYDQYALPEERGEAVSDVFARLRAEAGLQEKEALKNREKREPEER